MSLRKVSIAADRSTEYARKFTTEAEAEIDPPSGDFVKGRFLDLPAPQLRGLPRMNNSRLVIGESSYRLVSIEESGDFTAVKEPAG